MSLLEGKEVAASLRLASLETHSARLLRGLDFLLGSLSWSLESLSLVAVASGPGSFTGIRIGVATALGLAQTLGIPVVSVPVPDALAQKAGMIEGWLGVVLDAQRSQVYYAEYEVHAGVVRRRKRPALFYPLQLKATIGRRRVYLLGDALESCGQDLGLTRSSSWPRRLRIDLFASDQVGILGLRRRRQWKRGDVLSAEPLYIRPPDATRKHSGKR